MKNSHFLIFFALSLFAAVSAKRCGRNYESIFNFGDSLSDTGNVVADKADAYPGKVPYGRTFFNRPTGRSSDGRLIIDFIAEANGLPHLQPYLSLGEEKNVTKIRQGVNFAVGGATALDGKFFAERNIKVNLVTNRTLDVQMDWFRKIKPFLCSTRRECRRYFKKTLFFVGEIGGNDINYILQSGGKVEQLATVIPFVVKAITDATSALIEEGAKTLVVPGNLPFGCSPVYFAATPNVNNSMLDQDGCLRDLNSLSKLFNVKLNAGIELLRNKYQWAKIIYADYYGATMEIIQDPLKFGFRKEFQRACCGGGGPYNIKMPLMCGSPGSTSCPDPSQYISWDGIHFTEAAYRNIASGLLDRFSHPPGLLNTTSTFFLSDHIFPKPRHT